jgi:CubicO group peptidase (beta-lactamase class C family)
VVAVTLCAGTAGAQQVPTTDWSRVHDAGSYAAILDSVIPRLLEIYNVPGATLALVDSGRVVLSRSYGYEDVGHMRPVTSQSVFGAASISKLVTTWGVMRLVDAGRIDLDAKAWTYLSPSHRAILPFSSRVTVRQLLSHTAGLTMHSAASYWMPDSVPPLTAELTRRGANGKPVLDIASEPGTAWSYSGGGFGIIQLIIEDVTSQSFASYMQRSILQPLGMTRSSFSAHESSNPGITLHTDEAGNSALRAGYANLAAAGLYTTSADFARLATADMTRGRSASNILKRDDYEIMETAAPSAPNRYGLGNFIESTPAGPLVGHDGSDVGWTSMYRGLPGTGAAFIMFTSSSNGSPVYNAALCGWLKWKTGVDRKDYCGDAPQAVLATLYREDEAAAIHRLSSMREANPALDLPESYWNYLAYGMMSRGNVSDAIRLFHLITVVHPNSANAFDSLGDAYSAAQAYTLARAAYRNALALDPTMASAKASLQRLGNGR